LLAPAVGQDAGRAPVQDLAGLLPGFRMPLPGLHTGGQPNREQFEAAARAGLRTVINLRADGEAGFEWERAAAQAAGVRYVHIPVAGAAALTRENVERLDAALHEALAEGPALLHCASGNRVGALLALREGWLRGADADAALRLGSQAGLTGLVPAVRAALERIDAPSPP